MVKSLSILRESKTDSKGREIENRVILIPSLVKELKIKFPNLSILAEKDAGAKIDFPDSLYVNEGAKIVSHAEALNADIILGVKETKPEDFKYLKNNLWISFQHFAQSKERTEMALAASKEKGAVFLTLETMEGAKDGHPFFPCLAPMSEAAAKIVARHADEFALLSKKVIASGLPETGLRSIKVTIIGGGTAGKTAAEEFSERGCEVYLLEKNPERIKSLVAYFKTNAIRFPKVTPLASTPENLRASVRGSFFLVSAIYATGKRPEKMITLDLLKTMVPGGCVYPIDIDQGGSVEGVIETSILEPFDLPVIPGTEVFFFVPPNIPSMGARTTSEALGVVLLPYIIDIVQKGLDKAAEENPVIKSGINIKAGKIVHPGLASVFPGLK